MFNVSLSASMNTGISPFFKIGVTVVANVKAAVITSSPTFASKSSTFLKA